MKAFVRRFKTLLPRFRHAQDQDIQEELNALEQFVPRKELGNLTLAAEEARAAIGFPLLERVGADLRYAARSLKRDLGFAVIATLSLAIGIGANLAIFGLMDALLWSQLPIRDPEQLVSFENTSRSYFGYSEFAKRSGQAMQNVIAQSSVFEVLAGSGSEPPRRLVEFVSGDYFEALGIAPETGRSILPFDDNAQNPARVAVLSFAYWRRAFNQDAGVVGKHVRIGKSQFLIIGVAPEDFFGLSVGEAPDLWLPLTAYPAVFPGTDWLRGRNNNWLEIFGRLRTGVSRLKAQAILTPISVDIDIQRNGLAPSQADRRAMLQDSIRLIPASKGISELRDRFSKPLHIVFAMLAIGLLLACINVLSLQIARSEQSRKEFAIRLAVGASRLRVARQCLIETLLLSAASAACALSLFKPVTNAVVSCMTIWGGVPARLDVKIDAHVLAFVLLACIAVTLLCGLMPAIYATRQPLHSGLQAGSFSIAGNRHRRAVVRITGIVHIAVSLLLITGTCLFALSLEQLKHFDGGIRRSHLVELEIDPAAAGYRDGNAIRLDQNLWNRFRSISGVASLSYSQDGIYSGRNFDANFEIEGDESSAANSRHGIYDYVGPNFFTTLGTTVLAGRDFRPQDDAAAPNVVIVNQTLAARVFPNENPIGRRMYIADQQGRQAYEIIGVVRDVRTNPRQIRRMWYFPAPQHQIHPFSTCFLIRTGLPNAALLTRLRTAMHAENPKLQIEKFQTADELFERTVETDRLLARLGGAFGILAILLASAGIYGLLSYDVTRRTNEIGIRAALGANRADIVRLMLSQTAVIVGLGLAFGGMAANILTRSLRRLVFGVSAGDPRVEVAAALVLTAVALAAAWIPIQRAARVDPMRSLRAE
jgi:putative ABC transport system permease protein